jgi:hypothetical protein
MFHKNLLKMENFPNVLDGFCFVPKCLKPPVKARVWVLENGRHTDDGKLMQARLHAKFKSSRKLCKFIRSLRKIYRFFLEILANVFKGASKPNTLKWDLTYKNLFKLILIIQISSAAGDLNLRVELHKPSFLPEIIPQEYFSAQRSLKLMSLLLVNCAWNLKVLSL